jgi:hypothetical protein
MSPSLNTPSPAPQFRNLGPTAQPVVFGSIPLYATGDVVASASLILEETINPLHVITSSYSM